MRRDPIVISPYNIGWDGDFERERDCVEPILRPWLVRGLEHIGSTSIEGMPAKAIIDMLAVVGNIEDVDQAVGALDAVGWVCAPEPDDARRRVRSFCAPDVTLRTHHLHVVEESSSDWRGALDFRDYLRTHPGLAGAYAALKRELAATHGTDPNRRDTYRAGKALFIAEVIDVARGAPSAVVRDATADDVQRIAEVHVASWRVAYRGLLPQTYLDSMTVDHRLPGWRRWLETGPPDNQAIVVVCGDTVRGFATICSTRDSPPVLGALYLDPSSWDRGLGRALLQAVVDRARGYGHAEIVLWVHPDNARARRFYERGGWLDEGVERLTDVWGLQVPERRYRLRLSRQT